jgi:hypothetical protein
VRAKHRIGGVAFLAALALENGATLVTTDRDYSRFPNLKLASPTSDAAFHSVPMSSRFTKKSLVRASGRLVKTPCPARPARAQERRSARRGSRAPAS